MDRTITANPTIVFRPIQRVLAQRLINKGGRGNQGGGRWMLTDALSDELPSKEAEKGGLLNRQNQQSDNHTNSSVRAEGAGRYAQYGTDIKKSKTNWRNKYVLLPLELLRYLFAGAGLRTGGHRRVHDNPNTATPFRT